MVRNLKLKEERDTEKERKRERLFSAAQGVRFPDVPKLPVEEQKAVTHVSLRIFPEFC